MFISSLKTDLHLHPELLCPSCGLLFIAPPSIHWWVAGSQEGHSVSEKGGTKGQWAAAGLQSCWQAQISPGGMEKQLPLECLGVPLHPEVKFKRTYKKMQYIVLTVICVFRHSGMEIVCLPGFHIKLTRC